MGSCRTLLLAALGAAAAIIVIVVARELEPCLCINDTMDCSNRERSHLQPGEFCGNMKKANLRGNKLRYFPDGLGDFPVVDVSKNKIRTLPAPGQLGERVKVLDVSTNEIMNTAEDMQSLSGLDALSARENRLTSLSFLPRTCKLRRLDAALNSITDIAGPLAGCENLEMLILIHNNIVTLPEGVFAHLSKMEILDLRSNRITELSTNIFEGLLNLKYLRLSGNQISSLPDGVFSKLPNLGDLDLSENPLTTIGPAALLGLGRLNSLSVTIIREITLPSDLFASTEKLQRLTLDMSSLTTLPKDLFNPLQQLRKLDLLGSRLTELPEGLLRPLGHLETLNLYGSQVRQLPDGFLSGLHALGVLDMRANRLEAVPELEDCCDKLWYADFSQNNITALNEAAVRRLLKTDAIVHLRDNPVRPAGVRWVLLAADLEPYLESGECPCGSLRRSKHIYIDFCVDMPCGNGADFQDWVSAVRAANAAAEHPSGGAM